MQKRILQSLVLLVTLTQSAIPPPRTGDVARQLSVWDIRELEILLSSEGKPWFLNGDVTDAPGTQAIEAYLPPTTTTPDLRRGPVVIVRRRTHPITGVVYSEWIVEHTGSYAQVAIAGRGFDEIQGDQDINRPFRINGHFEDAELARLVRFLRSTPPTADPVNPIKLWPIVSVTRQADGLVGVLLREVAMQGQAITLRQAGENWIIVAVGRWVV